mmetsp:Transcript_87465/g.245546  ORF Transcript_87465/g.245546 Transcript_87465/m.245546 type:complete len:457 (-) Transcript_87465:978-2348(-)
MSCVSRTSWLRLQSRQLNFTAFADSAAPTASAALAFPLLRLRSRWPSFAASFTFIASVVASALLGNAATAAIGTAGVGVEANNAVCVGGSFDGLDFGFNCIAGCNPGGLTGRCFGLSCIAGCDVAGIVGRDFGFSNASHAGSAGAGASACAALAVCPCNQRCDVGAANGGCAPADATSPAAVAISAAASAAACAAKAVNAVNDGVPISTNDRGVAACPVVAVIETSTRTSGGQFIGAMCSTADSGKRSAGRLPGVAPGVPLVPAFCGTSTKAPGRGRFAAVAPSAFARRSATGPRPFSRSFERQRLSPGVNSRTVLAHRLPPYKRNTRTPSEYTSKEWNGAEKFGKGVVLASGGTQSYCFVALFQQAFTAVFGFVLCSPMAAIANPKSNTLRRQFLPRRATNKLLVRKSRWIKLNLARYSNACTACFTMILRSPTVSVSSGFTHERAWPGASSMTT